MNFKKDVFHERGCGVLMHISSLPGPYGIGDIGPAAHRFIDFLNTAGQRFWQFLPTCPGDFAFGCSPYMSLSSLAGNPLFISPELLAADGLLSSDDLAETPEFSAYMVDYETVIEHKRGLLAKAFSRFKQEPVALMRLEKFSRSLPWLADYALFMSIREVMDNKSWNQWPKELACRNKAALNVYKNKLAERLQYFKFEQFCFHNQWQVLREYAHRCGVSLIGDLPIYVAYDSVDVWANQSCFHLSKRDMTATNVAGVPPDYFSETGQRWGNPLYRWKVGRVKNKALYEWWGRRFQQLNKLIDVVRIDHFRGFQSYWQIPAKQETAVKGRWIKGPGAAFFSDMKRHLGGLQIIAEDLGIITPEVIEMRDKLGFPGMKILQFAFDSDEKNLYLPHNFATPNCIVYTGTHDNNTTLGWYVGDEGGEMAKSRARRYANSHSREGGQMTRDFIRMALASTAILAIIPMQDILGFGGDCRMNKPGTSEGNWRWRCAARFINDEVSGHLLSETRFYGR